MTARGELRAPAGARPELRALTGARGVAAWMVVLYHVRQGIAGLPAAWENVFAKGYLAVDFFFLLSGFVIWMSWSDRLRNGGRDEIARFVRKRIARIWPLQIVVLAGAVVVAAVLAMSGRGDPVRFPFAELPLHVLLLQNWGFTGRLSWNDPAWSISCELAAYLAFPLWVRLVDWDRWPSRALIAAAAGLLLLLAAAMPDANLGADITRYGLIRCLIEFATGGAVCALWLRWREAPRWPAIGAALAAACLLAAWGAGAPETAAVPGAFAALLLLLALTSDRRGNPLSAAPFHYLGRISYATYLGHFLLFFVFKLLFVDDASAIPPALIAAYLALVLGSSIALYHLVERPGQRRVDALRLPGRRATVGLGRI